MDGKFISPERPPEGAERELLTILAEECAEVMVRASKALRFGVSEVQPGQVLTNAQRIADEVGDILGVVEALQERGLCDQSVIDAAKARKRRKLAQFMQSI